MQEQPVDPNAVRRDWAERGFSCELWEDPPGREWNDFVHPGDELVMVIEGDVEFEVAGKTHRPRPGEEVFIPRGANHSVRNVGKTRATWLFGYNS
jgi:quercetin dioxygenase-like cupin family protein|tara:strand:+ start:305 stop:589 length:285 start_codon:yes stop_codon:yes gene_type:complete